MTNNIFYVEPQRVADWNDEMSYEETVLFLPSGRFFAIKLLAAIFKIDDPVESDRSILRKTIRDHPELAYDIRERYPDMFND